MDAVKPRHVRLESLTYVFRHHPFCQTPYPLFFASLRLCARPYLRGTLPQRLCERPCQKKIPIDPVPWPESQ